MVKLSINEIDKVIELIQNEKVIAIPTDTIYGFSCLPTSKAAVEKLCEIKQCDDEKKFIVLVSKNYNLNKLLDLTKKQLNFIKKNTPNPLTIVANKNLSVNFAPNFRLSTIAIRIPDNEFLQKILDKVGVLISTSCNIHGEDSINDCNRIIDRFADIDGIVCCECNKSFKSSTIIDISNENEYKIIRQGDFEVKL